MLDEDSREVKTFSTHLGLFRFKRLVLGLSAASEIIQRVIENMLRRCVDYVIVIDDILIFTPVKETHDQ